MSKGDKPVFNVRARQEPDREYMTTIGAAWKFKRGVGFVVKLHSVPVNWDGSIVLVPPKEDWAIICKQQFNKSLNRGSFL